MGIRIGIVGVGAFAQPFIPLFKAHPGVEQVVLCDVAPNKLAANLDHHGLTTHYASLDDLCRADVDAVAIFTQNWLHGPQAVQALHAGKHVYSAVPMGVSVAEIEALVGAVEATGRVYMLGETSYYYPATLYCRQRYQRGDFGHMVYGEAEYYHDFDHGLYQVYQTRAGEEWRCYAGDPPMTYPTHSTSMIISVTGARVTQVSGLGYVDRHADGLFRAEVNRHGNTFSNEVALGRLADGSMCRFSEFRRIGHPGTVRCSLLGTEGGFEHSAAGACWVAKTAPTCTPLDATLACGAVTPPGSVTPFLGVSSVHPVERLPQEFRGLDNGHEGSHQFLVDDFVRACTAGTVPPNHVWAAARYNLPGLVAHASAQRGGEVLTVPDFGPGPH
jgi:predicted dehydrogenase